MSNKLYVHTVLVDEGGREIEAGWPHGALISPSQVEGAVVCLRDRIVQSCGVDVFNNMSIEVQFFSTDRDGDPVDCVMRRTL